ncbi:MAG: hypothetical protein WD825_10010 [Gemmatimonadaceae bacterium]
MIRAAKPLVFAGALLVFAGCQDIPDVTRPAALGNESRAALLDGAHGGNAGFFFLPPIASHTRPPGALDATLAPVVEVCEWTANACVLPLVSRLNARLEGEHYGVNWHTSGLALNPVRTYRLRVLVAGTELGSAEIDVLRNGRERKGAGVNGAIPLVAGQTLPVKFRIEQGAVWVIGAAGGSISAADGQVQLSIPAGALASDVGITVQPTNVAPPAGGFLVAGAIYEFGPHGVTFGSPVRVTIAYDDANLPADREEHELKLLHFTGGAWEAAAGIAVDVQSNTITGSVTTFSPIAPGGGSIVTLKGSGTATVDGILGAAEWANAGCSTFQANAPGGGTTPATLCVMNDGTKLYVSVKYPHSSVSGDHSMTVDFDNLDDGLTPGDDEINAGGTVIGGVPIGGFGDFFYRCPASSCPNPGSLLPESDEAHGGTIDGTGKFTNVNGTSVIEMEHPLNSGDIAHDYSLAPGAVVGFGVVLRIEGVSTQFPGPMDHGHVVITGAVVDQQQPTIDTSPGIGNLAIGGGSEQLLAQVVTAGVSGTLGEVRFPVACDAGALVVEIQGVTSGEPNGVVQASQTVPAASLPTFAADPTGFRKIVFSAPASVTAGNKFAIVLKNLTGSCGLLQGPVGDPYLGGEGFFDSRPNQVGVWVLLGERHDLPFQTVVN